MSYNYKMIIAYDGARYQGWQINKNAKETIQGKLEYIIGEITGQEISVIGSGRTDKGVHAEGQIANFETEQPQDIDVFLSQINEKLPEDIIVRSLEIADERFNARLTAVDKTYRYTLWKADSVSLPLFERKYVYKLDDKMNIDNMRFGAAKFIGKHDFKGFSSDKTKKSTERTINSIEIVEDENTIVILINGTGFLYNMVRIIVGTLIEIGRNERQAETIDQIFQEKVREKAGYTAPAKGLCMVEVNYKKG